MNLTSGQKKDLETITYFIPNACKDWVITDKDIEDYFAYSDRGIKRGDEESMQVKDGYHALLEGKRWRGIHAHEIYEEGVLEGSMPYTVLFGDKDHVFHRSVVDYLKKEMFKGKDADIIEKIYSQIV